MRGNPQALFGKRPTEKDPAKGTSPAVDFTWREAVRKRPAPIWHGTSLDGQPYQVPLGGVGSSFKDNRGQPLALGGGGAGVAFYRKYFWQLLASCSCLAGAAVEPWLFTF